MAEEQSAPPTRIEFLGKSEEERIANAQMFQIGVGIMQRYGQQFTPDERTFMNIAFAQYARTVEVEGKRVGRTAGSPEEETPESRVPPKPPKK